MRDVDVVWLVEHVARELDVACAVRYLAEQRYGLTVEILPLTRNAKEVCAEYRPRVVAIPYAYNATSAGVGNFLSHWREPVYVNLSWEQLFYEAHLAAKAPSDAWAQNHVIHHAWGDFYKTYLIAHNVPEENIFVNGQPAYMLYSEPYCRYFPTRADMAARFQLDRERRWIFFPENYGWGFKSQQDLAMRVKDGQFDRETLRTMSSFCQDSLKEVLQWVKEAASNGSVEFVLRPRPATRRRDFVMFVQQAIGPLPERLHIIKDGTVREWIMASDVVLSSFSTSLIEAAVAGKPAYMVEPIPIPDPLGAAWYAHVIRLKTRQAFLSSCLDKPDPLASRPLQTWARAELLGRGDPILNLVDFLHSLCLPGARRPPIPMPDAVAVSQPAEPGAASWRRMRTSLAAVLRRMKQARTGQEPDADQDDFDSAEVARRTAALGCVLRR